MYIIHTTRTKETFCWCYMRYIRKLLSVSLWASLKITHRTEPLNCCCFDVFLTAQRWKLVPWGDRASLEHSFKMAINKRLAQIHRFKVLNRVWNLKHTRGTRFSAALLWQVFSQSRSVNRVVNFKIYMWNQWALNKSLWYSHVLLVSRYLVMTGVSWTLEHGY